MNLLGFLVAFRLTCPCMFCYWVSLEFPDYLIICIDLRQDVFVFCHSVPFIFPLFCSLCYFFSIDFYVYCIAFRLNELFVVLLTFVWASWLILFFGASMADAGATKLAKVEANVRAMVWARRSMDESASHLPWLTLFRFTLPKPANLFCITNTAKSDRKSTANIAHCHVHYLSHTAPFVWPLWYLCIVKVLWELFSQGLNLVRTHRFVQDCGHSSKHLLLKKTVF